MPPQAMRARCGGFRYCPDPLGIVTAEQLDKLEFDKLVVVIFVYIIRLIKCSTIYGQFNYIIHFITII